MGVVLKLTGLEVKKIVLKFNSTKVMDESIKAYSIERTGTARVIANLS